MVRRVAVSLFVAALLLTLFLPASLAAGAAPAEEGSVAPVPAAEDIVVDRLCSSVAAPATHRDRDRSIEGPSVGADADGVLEQSTRAAVYRAIQRSPGRTLNEVADTVDVSKSTVRYHARVLREAGLVDAAEVSGALRFAPAGDDVELQAVRSADGTGAVLEAVAAHEPASVTELARATDRAASTVSHHLSALEERGLVERERAGEAVVTTLAPATRTVLTTDRVATADD